MKIPNLPWDSSGNETELPTGCLKEEFESVSELSIVPENWHAFSPGQTLAVLHSAGILHGDLHRGHMFFDPDTGGSQLIDFEASKLNEGINPQECAFDLVPPYMSLGTEEFHAFFAGYISVAQSYIDCVLPGFTEELCKVCGIRTIDYVAPRAHSPDVKNVLDALGFTLSLSNARLVLKGAPSTSTNLNPLPDPSTFLLTIFGLILSGIDCSGVMRRIQSSGDSHYARKLKSKLAVLSHKGEAVVSNPKNDEERVIGRFFAALDEHQTPVHAPNLASLHTSS